MIATRLRGKLLAALLVLLSSSLVLAACEDSSESSGGAETDPRYLESVPQTWTVQVSATAETGTKAAAEDLVGYLQEMGRDASLDEGPGALAECRPNRGTVVIAGGGLGESAMEDSEFGQTWSIEETRCDGGLHVTLDGNGQLARQYAAYELLHAIGVRFFHPEEEWVPETPLWPIEQLDTTHTPAFEWRSVSLHLTHPLELGDAFNLGKEEFLGEGVNYIDWQLKNGASFGTGGIGDGEYDTWGLDRGLPRSAGFSLHNQQQGGGGIIDPDDPRSNNEQIAEAIDERMGDDPDSYPQHFSFTFNPSEFTELPDEQIVSELTFIANYFAENYPETQVLATNHGTAGEPTENYGVRFYDLPMFAPANLGVKVHTLMFYDLFRPAPVYGNENFNNLYDFMEGEYRERELWYFPESAWWLTFDIPVPLYLPITLQARDLDIRNISHMLDGKLTGHRVFGSGHEWGYWQNEYCSFRMAADLDYSYIDCIEDITLPMGEAADEVEDVILDVIQYQERDIIYGDILRYLVGTDQETEAAYSIGIEFHPLPPAPAQITNWTMGRIEEWRQDIEPDLEQMDTDYARLVERLNAVEELVPESAGSWFREIRDGIEVTGLRARHAWQVYGALVSFREAQLSGEAELSEEAEQLLSDAKSTTQDALEVIHRREEDYRYQPLSRSIAGGPEGTEDENWTGYSYRYLNRTHHAFYWTRIDELAETAFAGTGEFAEITDTVLEVGEETSISIVQSDTTGAEIDFGDGTVETSQSATHAYDTAGIYNAQATGELDGDPQFFAADIAVVEEATATIEDADVLVPSGASIIEPVIPVLVYGDLPNGNLAVGFTVDDDKRVGQGNWSELERAVSGEPLETEPVDILVPIFDSGSGDIFATLTVYDAVLQRGEEPGTLELAGLLDTEAVIDAVVTVSNGAFDEPGARSLVADVLGYTVDTLPERENFVLGFTEEGAETPE